MPFKVKTIFLTILSVLFTTASLKAQEQSDSLVRLDYGKTAELVVIDGQNVRKVIGPAQFMHNNTYMLCDTALWNIDTQIIDAIGNVSIIQEGTVLTSEKMVYIIDDNLAQFRGHMVQLEDSDHNVLRTSHLDYNTKDSVGVFDYGGSMRDKDGQIIESTQGTYDAKIKLFTFTEDVNMFTDSIFVKTTYLEYESERDLATFGRGTNAWQEENMLSAEAGWYDRYWETFFFRDNVHVMTDTQEGWSDSLYYYRNDVTVDMRGHAQVTDTSRNMSAVAGRMVYVDSLSKITLTRKPAVIGLTGEGETPDSLFFGADTIIYYTTRMCDLPPDFATVSEKRLTDLYADPVGTYRKKAAEAAAAAAAEAAKDDPNYRPPTTAAQQGSEQQGAPGGEPQGPPPGGAEGQPPGGAEGQPTAPPEEEAPSPEMPQMDGMLSQPDSLGRDRDSLSFDIDSLVLNRELEELADSLVTGVDSLVTGVDSLAAGVDSLAAGVDSLVASADSLMPDENSAIPRIDSLVFGTDSLGFGFDSLGFRTDSLGFGADSLGFGADSLGFGADSLGFGADSLSMEPLDTTKVGMVWAVGNIKLYREGMQIVCDSLEYCDLDSLARLYKDPLIWNDATQQYSADSVTAAIKNATLDRASLMSNAYVIIEEEELKYYNQIKSTETLAYFDSEGELSRFDALGTATALFFLREDDVVATVNKTESKMMYGTFANGNIQRVYYFDEAKSDAYPVVQLPEEEQMFKGFSWQPERRPADRYAVTTAKLRTPMREIYMSRPRAAFNRTNLYFPGYIPGIYMEIEQRDSLQKIRATQREIAEVEQERMEEQMLRDSIARADSVALADSLVLADSLARVDSIAKAEKAILRDSLAKVDSVKAAVEAQRVPTKEELKAKAKAEKAAARVARKEAKLKRWDDKDKIDAEKKAAKLAKKEAKLREKKRKYLKKIDAEEAKEQRRIEQYMEKISKKDAAKEAKNAASEAAKEAKNAEKAAKDAESSVTDTIETVTTEKAENNESEE